MRSPDGSFGFGFLVGGAEAQGGRQLVQEGFGFGRSVLGHDHVTFRVKASQEARIALSHTHTNVHTGGYSIDIGGGANSVTVIFKGIGDDKVEKAIHQTAGILKPDSFEPFWLSWKGGFIEVSHMTSPHALTRAR